jgi:hypothetical protein
LQENQKIVLKKNSDSKTNVSSIKLCIQIKFKPEGKRKKNITHVQIPGKKTPQKQKQKATTREGELFFLKNNHKINNNNTTLAQKTRKKTSYRQKVLY